MAMDIYDVCLKEVALEGLDGITIAALWIRLNQREEKLSVRLTENLQAVLWSFLVQNPSVEFFQLPSDREDPMIFNRYLGIDVSTGKHMAMAPDELDILHDVYEVKPVNQQSIKGSCTTFFDREDLTLTIKSENTPLSSAIESYGERRLVIVASQEARERVLRGPGITPQAIQNLTDNEYCILERVGRARWQGELQTVLNNSVFHQLKNAHIHYMMKSLFRKGLVTKQPYSYVRADKNNKVYQQILIHLPHFKRDARSLSDMRVDTVCKILKQSENRTIMYADLKQIISLEQPAFRKLVAKLASSGYVVVKTKGGMKTVTLVKTPAEKQEEEILDDEDAEEIRKAEAKTKGLIAELPITLQGHRYMFSTGDNGCSQVDLQRMMTGYGSLEARHVCRKAVKADMVNVIMVDLGKQRTQKYIAKNFATSSSHTKLLLAEKQKRKEIMENSDLLSSNESSNDNCEATTTSGGQAFEEMATIISIDSEPGTSTQQSNSTSESGATEALPDTSSAVITIPDEPLDEREAPKSSSKQSKWETHLTARKMRRTNVILGYVNEAKVVEGFVTFQKILQVEEKDEGLTTKICKKTVKRLVQKLNREGLLKYDTIPITSNECTAEVDFIMSLDCDPARLKTAIEQAQFKKYSDDSKIIADRTLLFNTLNGTVQDLENSTSSDTISSGVVIKCEDSKYFTKFPYGFQPKFVRTQLVHEYLWYLAYGHPYNDRVDRNKLLDYDKIREYSKERSWKRFLPPVPRYPNYGPGWLQVGDIAVLLPVTVICQVHQYTQLIDGLDQYVDDPLRKSTLVRHLPNNLKGKLLSKRKYIFSLIQVIETLCFMGLVTINQQKRAQSVRVKKESEMIYIHKNASILDTRKSDKGYSEVTAGIDYERLHFKFNRFVDIESYWSKLKDISLMTPLGVKVSDENDSDQPLQRTGVRLKQFINNHVLRSDPAPQDDGIIPGDNRGAGGLDSSMFAHLYRNWLRIYKVPKKGNGEDSTLETTRSDRPPPKRLPKLVPTVLCLTEEPAKNYSSLLKHSKPGSGSAPAAKRKHHQAAGNKKKKRKASESGKQGNGKQNADSDLEYEVVVESNINRNHIVKGGRGAKRKNEKTFIIPPPKRIRKAKPIPKVKKPRGPKHYTDLIDLRALSNLKGRLRVTFSSAEDEILIISKIACNVISSKVTVKGKPGNQLPVPGYVIRNFLLENCVEANDKTSTSCLRRIRLITKDASAMVYINVSVAELAEDTDFMKMMFTGIPDVVDNVKDVETVFLKLVKEIQKRLKDGSKSNDLVIPDDVTSLQRKYDVKVVGNPFSYLRSRVITEVKTPRDITLSVLENLMYVTLSLNEDEFSQYQAYKVFENYSQNLINEVWEHVKESGIICKKPDGQLSRQRQLPFAVPVYHLSISHFQSLRTAPMWKILSELEGSLEVARKNQQITCEVTSTCGPVIVMNVLILEGNADFSICYPDKRQSGLNFATSTPKSRMEIEDLQGPESVVMDGETDQEFPSNASEQALDDDTPREELKLYRKQRLANQKTVGVVEVNLNPGSSSTLVTAKRGSFSRFIQDNDVDVESDLTLLDSVKRSDPDVIMIDDDVESETTSVVREIGSKVPTLLPTVETIIHLLGKAGVIGIVLVDLKRKLAKDFELGQVFIQQGIKVLRMKEIIYVVGMYRRRVVLKKHSDLWFVTGTVFKGDRRILREELRKELTGLTKRHDGEHLRANKKIAKKYTEQDEEIMDPPNSPSSSSSVENSNTNPSDNLACDLLDAELPENVSSSSSGKGKTGFLTDSSNYQSLKFLCRPWHNVSGEVNYRTAKLLLTGVFLHILWHPGVTLKGLTEHFINIMQRVALTELLEKLASFKCITRSSRETRPRQHPWKLFQPVVHDVVDDVMVDDDDDYFKPTEWGMVRMTSICKVLDEMQKDRETSLCLNQDSPTVTERT